MQPELRRACRGKVTVTHVNVTKLLVCGHNNQISTNQGVYAHPLQKRHKFAYYQLKGYNCLVYVAFAKFGAAIKISFSFRTQVAYISHGSNSFIRPSGV
jgi:hypothetical protein